MAEATAVTSPPTDLKTYHGNCHCGAFKFQATTPPLESTSLRGCRCSICAKKGYLFVFAKKSDVVVTKGGGEDGLGRGVLKDYDFNSKILSHRFCGTCGTAFGIFVKDDTPTFVLNTRLFQDVDLWSYEVRLSDGLVTPFQYSLPSFPDDEELQTQLEGGEIIYPGSCHCGAVKFGLRTKPLYESDAFEIKECDCSICLREGGIITYPVPKTRVAMTLNSPDILTTYFPTARRFGPPPEVVAHQTDKVKEMIRRNCDIRPVNLRAMNFFLGQTKRDRETWEKIKGRIIQERGSSEGKPYEVPE